jgi:hypothetical protein
MRIGPACRIRADLETETDFIFAAKAVAGLFALERHGRITLRLNVRRCSHATVHKVELEAECLSSGARRSIAIDLQDQSYLFDHDLLARCDVYFKRSYHPPDLAGFPDDLRARIRPFGLNHAVAVRASRLPMAMGWARAQLAGLRPREKMASVPSRVRELAWRARVPIAAGFEWPPHRKVDSAIFFQTRLWPPGSTSDSDLENLNAERAALVRALRGAFGNRFIGGIVPSPFVHENCPDLVTTLPTHMRDYAKVNRRGLIGINCRGLHQSTGFKVSEYLAAAKCIVSDPIRNLLPEPLIEGRNLLTFRSPDECVTLCDRLLSRPDDARAMRRANWEYYRREVEPEAHMRNCLYRAFEQGIDVIAAH